MTSHCCKKICPHQQIHWNVKIAVFFHQCRERSLVSFLLFLLHPVSCLLSPVSCLLSPISCLLFPCFQSPVSCLYCSLLSLCFPSSVSCLLPPVSLLLSLVLLFPVYCLTFPVFNAVSGADLAEFAFLWSKLLDLGNLAILTLLADLADWKQIIFSGHGV